MALGIGFQGSVFHVSCKGCPQSFLNFIFLEWFCILIFYVDPDRHKQNEDFTIEMEQNHRAAGDNLYGFGVMNLKDAPMIPNGMARSMAKKRTAKNGAVVLADQDRTLSTAWGLGDCNNQFVLMIVSKEGELVFIRKGVLSEADKEAFYKAVEPYR